MELREMIMHLGRADRPDLATALREFIQAFEHHTARIHQMAHGAEQGGDKKRVKQVLDWIAYTYRLSTYAILASYLDDKQVIGYTHLHLDMSTRKWTERVPHGKNEGAKEVPARHQEDLKIRGLGCPLESHRSRKTRAKATVLLAAMTPRGTG